MNCELEGQIMPLDEFVALYINTAKDKKWDEVDEKLIPQITEYNGDEMAKKLLAFTGSKNSNIRDGVATAFSHLDISDLEVEEKVITEMNRFASFDKNKFVAGRAVVFLTSLVQKEGTAPLRQSVHEALGKFRARAEENNWVLILKKEITELNTFFT
jgi:hypothetical protein